MKQILPACVERNIRVTANAGGVNVEGCADAVKEVARELGLAGKLQIGIVTGDDIMARIDELLERGIELRNMDTGEPAGHCSRSHSKRQRLPWRCADGGSTESAARRLSSPDAPPIPG